jgi:hypothetical protein
MVTPEMAQAILQERASDIAKLQLEHEARLLLRNEAATPDASSKTSWFGVPSFVAHILRTASAH